MKLITHKPVTGHVDLNELNQRFRSLGMNPCQITAMLTDPIIAPKFFSGRAVIVVRDCPCGGQNVFAAWK